jgi:hypothetical protein
MSETPSRLTTALADHYRLERELGQGGMATVYLAQDVKHHRKVAIKVLRPDLAAVIGAERFLQEITTTAALQHPHILPLFDSGTAGGFLYYVMPYIEGETLRTKLDRETQLSIGEAVKITTEVADGFSPDSRWLAYQSNEGRMQVYVISYPGLTQKQAISTQGGTEPAWRPRGGELYFRNGASMMAVTIRTQPTLEVGAPRELFQGAFLEDLYGDRSFDVMPDGEHFLMLEANPAAAPELRVIRNWAAELKAQGHDE